MRNITVVERILSEWKKINKLEEKKQTTALNEQERPGRSSNGKVERS